MQPTSLAANRSMDETGAKVTHKARILSGLRTIKEGTFERIADHLGMKHDQVWKRLSELETDGLIINSGKTEILSSGKRGIVWKLKTDTQQNTNQPTLF